MFKLGKEITDKDLDDIMDKHDANKDGFLSMEEFKIMLMSSEWIITVLIFNNLHENYILLFSYSL